jgi:acyl-CoA thioesterase I
MPKFLLALIMSLVSVPAAAKAIMVFGDSLSAAYGIEVGQGWVALVQNQLNEINPDYKVINESISGDTTAGGLARIDQALASHKPSVVVVELGANDGLRGLPPKLIKSNLEKIIRKVQQAGAQALLLSMRIPPNYGKRYTEMFYNVYPELAKELAVPYVPFILEDVALIKELMQADGLHPNAKAQSLISDKIWPQLQDLLKKQNN